MTRRTIDYMAPLRLAWDDMVGILFRPFSFVKWLGIGFTAWCATWFEQGSGGGGGGGGGKYSSSGSGSGSAAENHLNLDGARELLDDVGSRVGDWVEMYGAVLLAVAVVAAILLFLVLALIANWVRCRSEFSFLDNVLRNRAEIREPWHEFRMEGNSLFLLRLLIGFIAPVIIALPVAAGVVSVLPFALRREMLPLAIGGGVTSGLLILAVAVFFGYVGMAVEDFVIPMMYRSRCGASAAIGEFRKVFAPRPGPFLLYGLIKFGLRAALGMLMFGALFVTLCCCCCIVAVLMLPFFGTVLVLPMYVFLRSVGPRFLEEFERQEPEPAPAFPSPPALPDGVSLSDQSA